MHDDRLLELGHEIGRAVITTNIADFYKQHDEWLAAARVPHPGIIVGGEQDYQHFGPFRRALLDLIAQRSPSDLTGNILWLSIRA